MEINLMRKEYKFCHRRGRNIQVCFQQEPNRWISTGTEDEQEALLFALHYLKVPKRNTISLATFLEPMLHDDFQALKDKDKEHGREKKETSYLELSCLCKKYILPVFGDCIVCELSKNFLEQKIAKLKENNLTKNRIVFALRKIFDLAIDFNVCSENIAKEIELFHYQENERQVFEREEVQKLFEIDSKGRINFSSLRWFAYFLTLRDTGWRPSEVSSLQFQDIDQRGGVATDCSVVYNGRKAILQNKIKTSKKGQRYKIGILSQLTLQVLQRLQEEDSSNSFIFKFDNKLLLTQKANRELERAFKIAGLELKGRTQYSFRHTFNTLLVDKLEERVRLELMGHTKNRAEYDHTTAVARLDNLLKNKIVVETLQRLY
jgi:site-specific recombinase XerD